MRKCLIFVLCLLIAESWSAPDHLPDHNHDDHHHHSDHTNEDQNNQGNKVEDHTPGHDHHGHGEHHGHHHHHDEHDDGTVHVRDCSALLSSGQRSSGVYRIKPEGCDHAIDAVCDMDTDGGGWTVIQNRGDFGNPADYFYKTWDEYKDGFGEKDKEFWIGNYHINHLTEQGDQELRIDMWDTSDNHIYATYGQFRTDGENNSYAIHIGDFQGNTRDCMLFIDGMKFSTRDRDNDLYENSCAEDGVGAWWYRDCSSSNLNGPHMEDPSGEIPKSIYWFGSHGNPILLRKTKMMVRRKTTSTSSN